MDDRFNTIAGWTLFAGIVALGGSIVAEKPIAFYLSSADAAKGEQVFKKCTACHNADKGGANALGPNLWGMLGEPIGKGHGFAFSDALASKGGTWDWDTMSAWLKSPKAFAPGTKMTFAGLSNPEDRANVIAFLNSRSDSPKPLPAAPAEAAAPDPGTAPGATDAQAKAGSGTNDGAQKAEAEPVIDAGKKDVKGGGEADPTKKN